MPLSDLISNFFAVSLPQVKICCHFGEGETDATCLRPVLTAIVLKIIITNKVGLVNFYSIQQSIAFLTRSPSFSKTLADFSAFGWWESSLTKLSLSGSSCLTSFTLIAPKFSPQKRL